MRACGIQFRRDTYISTSLSGFLFRAAATARFIVVHVSGENPPGEIDDGESLADCSSRLGEGPECEDESTAGRDGERKGGAGLDENYHHSDKHGDGRGGGAPQRRGGRWEPGFLEAELRETCLRQLEIPVFSANRSVERVAPNAVV